MFCTGTEAGESGTRASSNRDQLFAGWSFSFRESCTLITLTSATTRAYRKSPCGLFSVVQPEPLFLSTSPCPLRLGRGLLCDNPLHPRMPEASPLDSVKSLKAVDMGFSLRSSSLPVVGKALLRGFGSPLGGYAPCGVFLRAMPRPAKLSRCRPHRQLTTYDNLLSPRLKNHLVYR